MLKYYNLLWATGTEQFTGNRSSRPVFTPHLDSCPTCNINRYMFGKRCIYKCGNNYAGPEEPRQRLERKTCI